MGITPTELYASFGYEQQLASCRELLVGLEVTLNRSRAKVVLAPIYESVRFEAELNPQSLPVYGSDPETGQDLFGGSLYRDWYYNLGDKGVWQLELGVFSGDANPLKGYSLYGAGSLSANGWGEPNISSNNTPTLNGRISWQVQQMQLFASISSSKTGSTWASAIDPSGKHNRQISTAGFDLQLLDSLRLYSQYTHFISGLAENSAQNRGEPMFRDLTQQGWFMVVEYQWQQWLAALGYESFDRYDFQLFQQDNFVFDAQKAKQKQSSVFGGLRWQVRPELSWHFLLHQLQNTQPNASQIFTENPEFGAGLRYNLGFYWHI